MKTLKKSLLISIAAFLAIPIVPNAVAEEGASALEEITVTGRKREESLVDVPVSISVLTADDLLEEGITSQQELFDATPGLSFDTATGDRNSAQPAVRGVQSNEIATTQQKVNSFIDGMPMLGQVGSLQFSGIEQVEVYRGPQSAAFGRSTFAGAINYVTSDAADEFEAKFQVRLSDLGSNELGLAITGPITEKVGYRLSFMKDEFTGPDEWTASDGVELGTQETETITGKLNFEFSDSVYGELMFTKLEQSDGAAAQWRLNPADCQGDSGVFLNSMGANIELPTGAWNCDPSDGSPERNHDVLGDFTSGYDVAAFTAAAGMGLAAIDTNANGTLEIEEYLAQTLPDGQTFEQALLGQTVDPFAITERDRIQGNLNFEFDNGLLTVLGMYNEEFYQRWNDSDGTAAFPVFGINMMTGAAALDMSIGSMSDPTDIEERYAEVRWVSPEDQRLRYSLSASFYEYDFLTNVYFNYGALARGLTLPSGDPVDPLRNLIISNSTENIGASFGLWYDLNESTTLTFEGRFQSDENCGADVGNNLSACTTTESFAPRLAINKTLSDTASVYAQVSVGTNPAGINITYSNPLYVEALLVASGQIASPFDGFTYDGSDGVHFPAAGFDADTYVAYDEEVLTNFEVGAKGEFADGAGTFATALYYMDWKDLVSARNLNWDDDTVDGWNEFGWSNSTGNRTFLNAGDAEFYGLETVASYQVNDIFEVGGNLSLTSSTYASFCSPSGPDYTNAGLTILTPDVDGVEAPCATADGNNIPRTSEIKGSFNVSARLPQPIFGLDTSLRWDIQHTGSHFTDDFNLIERDPVTTMNLSATMRNDNLTLRVFVNNLTDNDDPRNLAFGNFYTDNANPSVLPTSAPGWTVTPTRPRDIGITAIYSF